MVVVVVEVLPEKVSGSYPARRTQVSLKEKSGGEIRTAFMWEIGEMLDMEGKCFAQRERLRR